MSLRSLAVVLLLTGVTATRSEAANAVSHQGITWSFSSDRPTGTFANGEPWVVGPVTVTAISPNPSSSVNGTMHGSMKNPVPAARQGFDSNVPTISTTTYSAALNVALSLPANFNGGDVLVSSKTDYSYPNYFETICALTVLSSPPPAGSFRPGIYGTDRAVRWNKSQINWSVLKNLAPVAGIPSQAEIEAKLPPLPWFEWHSIYLAAHMMPWRNTAAGNGGDGKPSTYGREIAKKWGEVGLWLNTSNTQAAKEKAMIQTIQCGIDIWSYVTHGGGFYHDGGHKCGRKFPVFLAAVALNDSTLRSFVSNPRIFQEDTQTFYVQQSDVGRAVDSPNIGYSQSHVGMAEWGIRHAFEPNKDDSRWTGGTPYRHVVWPAMGGQVLAAELMGQKAAWGHPAIFDYNARYHSQGGITGFVGNMWTAHKSGGVIVPPIVVPPPPPTEFAVGNRVSMIRNTNVRATGSLTGTLLGVQSTGALGTILSGPVSADGVTWWQVNFDNGADGWAGADNFALSNSTATAPSAPTGLKVIQN